MKIISKCLILIILSVCLINVHAFASGFEVTAVFDKVSGEIIIEGQVPLNRVTWLNIIVENPLLQIDFIKNIETQSDGTFSIRYLVTAPIYEEMYKIKIKSEMIEVPVIKTFVLRTRISNQMNTGIVADEEVDISIAATNMKTLDGKLFKVRYNENELQLLDAIAQSYETNLTGGVYGDIAIVSISDGSIQFRVLNKTIEQNQVLSGVLNLIRFRGLKSCDTAVIIEVIGD